MRFARLLIAMPKPCQTARRVAEFYAGVILAGFRGRFRWCENRHAQAPISCGKKYVPWILKLVARILKSEPLIFSLLPSRVNALKKSFRFSCTRMPVSAQRFTGVEVAYGFRPEESCFTSTHPFYVSWRVIFFLLFVLLRNNN